MGIWIHNFLTNRQQQVLVNDSLSQPSDVKIGIPQVTVLGPILFLFLIDLLGKIETEAMIIALADSYNSKILKSF